MLIRVYQIKINQSSIFIGQLKKYGWDNFTKEIIRSNFETSQMLKGAEIFYIALYNTFYNGYNMTRGGEGNLGYVYGQKTCTSRIKGFE